MKFLLIFCMILAVASAEARHCPMRRRVPHKSPISQLSWKQIAAGGAAAGTVVAAYKIGNGVENGLEKAAEKEPALFLKLWTWIPHILVLLGIWALYKWFQKFKHERRENESSQK